MRKVVITGIGVVSPVGSTLDSFWQSITSGVSGIGHIDAFDTTDFAVKIAGQVTDFDPNDFIARKEQRRMDRYCHLALGAAKMAVSNSGLDTAAENPERMGALVGSGVGGIKTVELQHDILNNKGPGRCSPFTIPQMICNMASGLIAIDHNLKGPNYSPVSACATGAHSIGEAMKIIRRDEADVMIAGGAEASITPLSIAGFAAMRALSTRNDEPKRASRPFDVDRDGFVMGEGAAIVVVEELERAKARGAHIYAEVAGFGMSCDAFHMTAPSGDGEGATRAIKLALQDGQIAPEDVDYINAHGTSTPLNDKIETRAIKGALGEEAARKVMISSSKSMTGHLLGAAGGIETAVCALAIENGVVPPTINHDNPDPECDLDYIPNVSRETEVNACLNNSLGFGGHNACLAIKKA
ncbi:MAG: beta-ketoacyl-ACP synthase II [Kiritimatiellia bacterium]|jgi:3-oxoacyl-[acyl-carrier-protein] synthase II|nr:beta-ketoacyl-ACP synthase II [Kiritimatiellia bacterium]MDP6848424.1 beta-ketoacyl-ACP synthase II [Kiritimatiellia bacterium]